MRTHEPLRGLVACGLSSLLLLLVPLRAEAFGMGTSVGLQTGEPVGGFGPTLDLMFDPIILQIHATETLQAAFDGGLFLGANLYVDVASVPISGALSAVVQPGGGVDLFGNPADLAISGQCRFGVQTGGGGGGGGGAAAPTPAPQPTVPGYTPQPVPGYSPTPAPASTASSASSGRAGFGVYIVPEIGFVTNGGNEELYAGGALQISVWFPL